MKLLLNNVDLATLGVLRMLGKAVQREPVEAPQRERVTLRVRLDFFETSFVDNAQLVETVRAALKQQNTPLVWQDDNSSTYLNRTVVIAEDDEPGDGRSLSGTTQQAITFSVVYYNHDVVTNCLNATWQGQKPGASAQAPGANTGPALDLGAVTDFKEGGEVEFFDKLRPQPKQIIGTVTAAGRFQADTSQALDPRRAALLATKDAMQAALGVKPGAAAGPQGLLVFGTFSNEVKISKFEVTWNQPNNFIEWTLTATYTIYPNESDYYIAEYRVQTKVNALDGIQHLTISGRIAAPSTALARARLAVITGALVPAGYVNVDSNLTDVNVDSGQPVLNLSAGLAFVELNFEVEYRDTAGLAITYQSLKPAGTNASPLLDLGTMEHFSDGYQGSLFDTMRDQRKRGGGLVTGNGRIWVSDSLTLAAKRAALVTIKKAIDAALVKGDHGTLNYGGFFSGNVRVMEFVSVIDRAFNSLGWTLTASYTKFPLENDYAICEFTSAAREDKVSGIVHQILSGRIGAPTADAAMAKLLLIRAAAIPSGYTLESEDNNSHSASTSSGAVTGTDQGDGQTFIELTFNDAWRKTAADIVYYTLKIQDQDDTRGGFVTTSFSGQVMAKGSNQDIAFQSALAQAETLADNKYPFKVRSDTAANEKLFLTAGGVTFVAVDFNFEYLRKGLRTYTELASELTKETFGQDRESVSGFIMAPNQAAALAAYQTNVRSLPVYADALVLNEKYPTLTQAIISDGNNNNPAALDQRFGFSFTVHRIKGASGAMNYSIRPRQNILANELRTNVSGVVYAASEDAARAYLAVYTATLNLGSLVEQDPGSVNYQKADTAAGENTAAFLSLEFNQTYVQVLSGTAAVLESECTEEVLYSGVRNVEKAIPDNVSVIQNVGTTCGQVTINAMAKGTTEAAARAYVVKCMGLLRTSGNYNQPPRIQTRFQLLELASDTPRAAGARVKIFVVTGTFAQLVPNLPFVA